MLSDAQRSRGVGGRDELGGATGTLTAKRERWMAKQRKGFSLPLSCRGGSYLDSKLAPSRTMVEALTRISPGPAAPHSRALVLAVSPITV